MRFPYLLFDADDTLFDFPKASSQAFSAMCRAHDVPDTPEVRQIYHDINRVLWDAFDRGEVTKEFVTLERFVRFFRALGLDRDPAAANRDYLAALGSGVYPLPHAEEVCRLLVNRGHRLYIATNAVASVQRSRLQGSVFAHLITDAFISEEAGASKPDKAYYDYALSRIPGTNHQNVLETPWLPISEVPTTPHFPVAGSIRASFPPRQISALTTSSTTCASCLILCKKRPAPFPGAGRLFHSFVF